MSRLQRSPEEQWERFGQVDPFFGVITHDQYHRDRLDDAALESFFASGREQVQYVLRLAQEHTGREIAPRRVLDFGCGVGRVLVAFAEHAPEVVGVDVSPSMLAEARRNADIRGLEGIELVETPQLDRLAAEFDIVHSSIVFPHIPPKLGYALFERVASLLRPGGVGVLHVTLSAPTAITPAFFWAVKHVPLVAGIHNLRIGREWSYPTMEFNRYDLERLVAILRRVGFPRVGIVYRSAAEFGGRHAADLVFERPV